MLNRLFERQLLCPADLRPSRDDFEVIGVFNPGAVLVGDEVILLVRVVERPKDHWPGYAALPRWSADRGVIIDWLETEAHVAHDTRVVKRKSDGLFQLPFISHLRVVRCGDGRSVTSIDPVTFGPQSELEEFGVEDPRVTFLDARYYFTYVCVSRHGVSTALASTTDFRSFERHGVIFCPENKDVVLFSERLGGDYCALHRPHGGSPFARPEMWLARSPDLIHWGRHAFLSGGQADWESGRVGAGPPPLRTPDGWLEIYHGNRAAASPGKVGTYSAGAMLLDLDDPSRVLRRTPSSIFEPTADFERQGFVPDVVFPTGIVERGETLLVYYGAADTCVGVVEFSRAELMGAMRD